MDGPALAAPAAPAARGLDSTEAARRLAEHGPNLPPRAPRRGLVGHVTAQLRDPMILLLGGAFVVLTVLGDLADGLIVIAVIVVNTALGTVQEVRAETALDALDQLSAPQTTVIRDGEPSRISGAEVVPGDLLLLAAGDVVPADGLVLEAAGLEVDESTMTGESVPVLHVRGEGLAAGTVVTRGRATAVTSRTGAESSLGVIASAIARGRTQQTPLQRRLARLSVQLVAVTVLLAGLVLALSLVRGEDPVHAIEIAVSLAVAAIPESLPAVVAVALALGAHRMAGRNALVRRLPAVETLGSVSVLATDKTGTLTEGRMTVTRLWTPAGTWDVGGVGYDVAGLVVRASGGVGGVGAVGEVGEVDELMRDLALCNDARLVGPSAGTWSMTGDPMEAALLVAVAKHDLELLGARDRSPRREEQAFDADTRRMTTLHEHEERWLAVCKGAPETVLALLDDDATARRAQIEAQSLADQGFRVLAVADTALDHRPTDLAHPGPLRLRGLVALLDPPRPAALEVIRACREAGIRTVMITGDHPATAHAIAAGLTITAEGPEVCTGDEVARGAHADRVERIGVYARTRPEHKVDIIRAWQRRGAVVAMTGDGVNDAPALRAADIGVAMGDRGTEVARQAADLVLADDDLRTLVAAVREGRRVFANIRRFLAYGLAGGFAEVAVLLLGPLLGMPTPLVPGQILWINLVTHGLPGVAFGGEPADPADMRVPSPSPERSVLGGLFTRIAVMGSLLAATALVAGAVAPVGQVQTSVFWCLGLAQLWLALALRAPRRGVRWTGRTLEGAVLVAAALLAAAAFWSPMRQVVDAGPLDASQIWLTTLVSIVPALVVLGWTRLRGDGPTAGR